MNRPLPERYKNLPPEISMDYRMTADNLWVVWVKNFPEEKSSILSGFVLATPGKLGLEEIEKAEHGHLICAFSLTQMREMVETLNTLKPTFLSRIPTWLGGHQRYLIVEETEGNISFNIADASSEEECFVQVLEKNASAKILWVTPIAPFFELQHKLEQILEEEKYSAIGFDRRADEPEKGHPWDWFEYMKRPEFYSKAKEAQEYFREHPEAWEIARQACLEDLKKGTGPIFEE